MTAPPPFHRRALPLLGAGLAAPWLAGPRPAAAQARIVLPAPMPCATRPGDIVGLVLEGNGTTAETILVFGQAFRPGDLPQGRGLAARSADGAPLRAQLDVKTRHPDGSARFGIVSLAAPALRNGAMLGVVLSTGPATGAPPIALAQALAGRQAVVEITPASGAPWRAELAGLLGNRPTVWQAGPLAAQARIVAAVPAAAVGGATSVRLVADLALRADGSLWLDLWLRNDVSMQPGGGAAAYGLTVAVDGREVLRAEAIRQPHYTAWGRQLRVLGGGQAPAPPFPRLDAAYLAETGAVARYDLSAGVEEAVLNRYAALLGAADWAAPFSPRSITQQMGMTGDRSDIGPTTEIQASWLITGDRRAAALAIGQAEAAGGIPWHHWDPTGGPDRAGGWLDQRRWPKLWTDPRGGPPPNGLLQPVPRDTGWQLDAAHQPALGFVPYLLTGRRAFLDNLLAQAAWNVISVWPWPRTAPGMPGDGAIILRDRQVRAAAWGIREIDQAAWSAPDDDPAQGYFRWVSEVNWGWLRAQLPALTAVQGESHGRLPGAYGTAGAMAPWQQDYFISSAAVAARHGSRDAREVLTWLDNFVSGRFLAEARGFPRHDGITYNLVDTAPGTPGRRLQSWAEIAEATRERNLSNGDGWRHSNGNFGRLGLMALALLQDTIGSARAREAYAWLNASDAPNIGASAQALRPTLSIVPRGQYRVAGRAPRCGG